MAEINDKKAQDALGKLQRVHGREREHDAETDRLRDAEYEWLEEARRNSAERELLVYELEAEERSGSHARELVVSCHSALLRGQHEQQRLSDQLEAARKKGFARAAQQQSDMAADLRSLGNLLARCTAQRRRRRPLKSARRPMRLHDLGRVGCGRSGGEAKAAVEEQHGSDALDGRIEEGALAGWAGLVCCREWRDRGCCGRGGGRWRRGRVRCCSGD